MPANTPNTYESYDPDEEILNKIREDFEREQMELEQTNHVIESLKSAMIYESPDENQQTLFIIEALEASKSYI